MASELDRLERILGGKFERRNARAIPGTQSVDGVEIVYFSDDGKIIFVSNFEVSLLLLTQGQQHAVE
ncbi:hypothetical protein LZK76_34835 (plasmid) [Rhizobium leguminosarum]|nr:hypothetical protein LZK76_34835 [Rhizobium leguminosarum]